MIFLSVNLENMTGKNSSKIYTETLVNLLQLVSWKMMKYEILLY